MSRFAMRTRSHDPNSLLRLRNHSRAKRLIRLRRTAQPTLRVTVMPRRVGPPSFRSLSRTTKYRVVRRAPNSEDARKSPLRILRRRTLRASAVDVDGSLLPLRDPRELVTTLCTPAREHVASRRRAHPGAETVIACAPDSAGLKCALHEHCLLSRATRWACMKAPGPSSVNASAPESFSSENFTSGIALLRTALI